MGNRKSNIFYNNDEIIIVTGAVGEKDIAATYPGYLRTRLLSSSLVE